MTTCPGCGEAYTDDERRALALWQDEGGPPRLTIWCDRHKHRLAKVHDRDGRMLVCFPPSRIQLDLIGLRKDGQPDDAGPGDLHPYAVDLAEWLEHPHDEPLRCKCGAFILAAGELANALNYSRGAWGKPSWPWSQGKYLARRLRRRHAR